MQTPWLIAGGGIGGMAAACALAQAHQTVAVLEQAQALTEVGAGIQLGPNAMRVLHHWGLQAAYARVACFPSKLEVRDAIRGSLLGTLPFDSAFAARYGAPYSTVHRADLLRVLCDHAHNHYGISPRLRNRVTGWNALPDGELQIQVQGVGSQEAPWHAHVLIGADGLWSQVRQQLLPVEAPPRFSGIVAYRALVAQSDLPAALRSQHITVWLAPHLHIVQYPVCAGTHLNTVALMQGPRPDDLQNWNHSANASVLRQALRHTHAPVMQMAQSIGQWRLWPLCDRPPIRAANAMAQGRVALLGDAAHPMRPFIAQGAGMALEDAATLAHCIVQHPHLETALATYAQQRWQRCAQVQQRAIRNGDIFHCSGVMRIARNLAMRTLGKNLLDVPWLYQGGPIV